MKKKILVTIVSFVFAASCAGAVFAADERAPKEEKPTTPSMERTIPPPQPAPHKSSAPSTGSGAGQQEAPAPGSSQLE